MRFPRKPLTGAGCSPVTTAEEPDVRGRRPALHCAENNAKKSVMSTYAYRFVAQEKLPSRLSDFDLDTFFRLTGEDVAAIRDQFRSDHRAPAALMVLFLRAAGRPLDRTTVLPRNLLRYVGTTLNTAAPTIASLRSIYQRSQTLYKHQLWAKNYLGLKDLDDAAETELVAILALQAREASHPDDLVTAACHWLYERKILIPGERRVQDWARARSHQPLRRAGRGESDSGDPRRGRGRALQRLPGAGERRGPGRAL